MIRNDNDLRDLVHAARCRIMRYKRVDELFANDSKRRIYTQRNCVSKDENDKDKFGRAGRDLNPESYSGLRLIPQPGEIVKLQCFKIRGGVGPGLRVWTHQRHSFGAFEAFIVIYYLYPYLHPWALARSREHQEREVL